MVKAPAKESQRDRVLTTNETRIFWKGLDEAPMTDGIKLALKLQLVTAQRKGEVVGAALEEFDLEDNVWTIPAVRSKNGQAHRVPLSPLALELIRQARFQGGDTPWLFPSPTADGPILARSINRAVYKTLPDMGLENVTPHDLRRTAASGMTALGIPRLTVSKILNHVEKGVTAVYDRHSYDAEKRHALEAWASRLKEIVSGKPTTSNVVTLAEVQ
jgi:integrase